MSIQTDKLKLLTDKATELKTIADQIDQLETLLKMHQEKEKQLSQVELP